MTSTLVAEGSAGALALPTQFSHLAGFIGPLATVEASIARVYEAEAVLCGWRPSRVAVIGSGTRALLTTMALRLRGLDVTMFSGAAPTFHHAVLVSAIGAQYAADATPHSSFDVILHANDTQALATRGLLARTPGAMESRAVQPHVDAAIRDIATIETRHPGWLARLSRV